MMLFAGIIKQFIESVDKALVGLNNQSCYKDR